MTDKTDVPPAPTPAPVPAATPASTLLPEAGKGPSKKSVAIGAAVGIGSAAIVAALLYTRRR